MDKQFNKNPLGKESGLTDADFATDLAEQSESNLPLKVLIPGIFLISGISLLLFMMFATAGLLGYIIINRPKTEDVAKKIDLSRISSTVPDSQIGGDNGLTKVVEGSAPGLLKVETESVAEIGEISPAGRVLPGGQTYTSLSVFPELPTSYYENRLQKNIRSNQAPPTLEHEGLTYKGPQRVQFIVGENGNLHDHTLGTASFAETEIVGASGEWQVRPWWQPGWVPQTVDCGEPGTAAIGGHVSWSSVPGPFHDLGAMTSGDRIRCQANDGSWFTYEVSEVVQIGYNNTEYYWETRSNLNDHQLTLFTCKPEITGIIVVRAQLVDL